MNLLSIPSMLKENPDWLVFENIGRVRLNCCAEHVLAGFGELCTVSIRLLHCLK